MIGGLGLTPSGNIGMDVVAVFEAVSKVYISSLLKSSLFRKFSHLSKLFMKSVENLVEMANILIEKTRRQEMEIVQIQQEIGWTQFFYPSFGRRFC